jgi:hypothetical protein
MELPTQVVQELQAQIQMALAAVVLVWLAMVQMHQALLVAMEV